MKRLSLLLLLGCLGLGTGCHLRVNHLAASVQRPSNVALYFSVEKHDGTPVGGLAAKSFKIYEDGKLISPFESKQTILNPEVAVEHFVVLLLDLSGSITKSGATHALVAGANTFSEKVGKTRKVAVFGFDGSSKLRPIAGFTQSGAALTRALSRVGQLKSRDPSTNLNGAVTAAVDVLEKKMAASRQPIRFGTLVVFTDGTDRAHRVTTRDMHRRLDQAKVNVFAIGLGGEISTGALSRLGRTGFVKADKPDQVGRAFDKVAETMESAARKFYILSYCSPSRAGKHTIEVRAYAGGKSGSLRHRFDAKGFGPRCDPKHAPKFRPGKILLKGKR